MSGEMFDGMRICGPRTIIDVFREPGDEHPGGYKLSSRPNRKITLLHGYPNFAEGKAVLLDTLADSRKLSDDGHAYLDKLALKFPDGLPKHVPGDRKIYLKIFIDDAEKPRYSTRLIDLIQGSLYPRSCVYERNLFERIKEKQKVKIVLEDPEGAWVKTAPRIEVVLNLR